MKILMISTLNLSKQNGGKVHFTSLAKGFRAQGHWVEAILATTGDRTTDTQLANQYFDHVTFTSDLLSRLIPFSKTTINSLGQTFTALKMSPQDYDWVYLRSTPLSIFVLRALQRKGFQKIFVEHNGWFADELVMMGVPLLFKRILEKLQTAEAGLATQLRVVVPGIQEKLLANAKKPDLLKNQTVIIGNGADIDHYHPIERTEAIAAIGRDPDKVYLGFIGDLDPWQGVEIAIQAMAQIRRQVPNAELLVVGAGRQLETLVETYGNLPHVHFIGTVPYDESNQYINCFDLALLPKQGLSGIGYSPIKLYTYAAAGRTILASQIRGIEEYGDEQGFITLHQTSDVDDLARQACALLADPETCKNKAILARQYAEAHFSWQQVADKITQTMQAYDRQ